MSADLDLLGFSSSPGSRLAKASYRAGLTIYPHDNNPAFPSRSTSARYLDWEPTRTEGTVVSLSWSKRLGKPAAQWSAVVKLGPKATINPLAGDILDGDWVDLEINRNGVLFGLGRGIVDSVRLKKSSSGGATSRTLTITGRDHGALFEFPISWNNIFVKTISELGLGLHYRRIPGAPTGTPGEMFERLILATFAKGSSANQSEWTFPPDLKTTSGKRTFVEDLQINVEGELRGRFAGETQLWTGSGQTLQQTLTGWCNPLLNEWFYDFDDAVGRMQATIRERPYVNLFDNLESPYFGLAQHVIPDWMVTEDDLGRGGAERFNIFQIMADMHYYKGQEQAAITATRYSKEEIERYGIRPYAQSTKYITFNKGGGWEKERAIWQALVADWFSVNPYLLSGTMTIGAMLPEVKIGSRITIDTGDPKTSLTAYVEGVDHSFKWAPSAGGGPDTTTSLTLTRGFIGTDADHLKLVKDVSGKYQDKF